jgi:hypothetical protein
LTLATGTLKAGPSFDGVNPTLMAGSAQLTRSDAALRLTGAMSVEAVVMLKEVTVDQNIIVQGGPTDAAADNYLYTLMIAANGTVQTFHEYGAGNNYNYVAPGVVRAGEWVHILLTRSSDGTVRNVYVNGLLMGSETTVTPATDGSTTTTTVLYEDSFTTAFQGLAAMLAVYDTTLSSVQAKALSDRRMGNTTGVTGPTGATGTGGGASSLVVKQFANNVNTGTMPLNVGTLCFDAGDTIATPAFVVMGRQGTGTATFELTDDQTATVVATWTSSTAYEAASIVGGASLVIPTTGLYSMRIRASDSTTTALLYGINWVVQ